MGENFQKGSAKKLRVLTVSLIFSGALNIGLIATGLLTGGQEHTQAHVHGKVSVETSVDRALTQMQDTSFHSLVSYLTNKQPIGEGYLRRDLALATLVFSYHFHLEKALSGSLPQRREVCLSNGSSVQVFPGLTDAHFDAVIRFAYEEKWPLTALGLFDLLKKGSTDESLLQAFSLTPEYRFLDMLFQKTGVKQPTSHLVQLISEGSWDLLDLFAKEQAQLVDISVERRRSFLLGYLAAGSKTAAQILLETDYAFALKRLEDQGIVHMLGLLEEKTPAAELLCIDLLRSPRSDVVWERALRNLYSYAGEQLPPSFDLKQAMARFLPSTKAEPSPQVEKVQIISKRQHTVKEGETLWKIAKTYNVKVDEIVNANNIEKNRLLPGMTLEIP